MNERRTAAQWREAMNDYYHAIILERGDAEAALIFADDCRKHDATIAALERELASLRAKLARVVEAAQAIQIIEEETDLAGSEWPSAHSKALVALDAAVKEATHE